MSDSGISLSLTCWRTVPDTDNERSKITHLRFISISDQSFPKQIEGTKEGKQKGRKRQERVNCMHYPPPKPPEKSEKLGMGETVSITSTKYSFHWLFFVVCRERASQSAHL